MFIIQYKHTKLTRTSQSGDHIPIIRINDSLSSRTSHVSQSHMTTSHGPGRLVMVLVGRLGDRLLAGLSNERHVSHMLYLRDSTSRLPFFLSLTHLIHTHRETLRSFYLLRRWVDWIEWTNTKNVNDHHHHRSRQEWERSNTVEREKEKNRQDWESTAK